MDFLWFFETTDCTLGDRKKYLTNFKWFYILFPEDFFKIMKASPPQSRLSVGDAVNQLKSTLDDINNQKRQHDIVDK